MTTSNLFHIKQSSTECPLKLSTKGYNKENLGNWINSIFGWYWVISNALFGPDPWVSSGHNNQTSNPTLSVQQPWGTQNGSSHRLCSAKVMPPLTQPDDEFISWSAASWSFDVQIHHAASYSIWQTKKVVMLVFGGWSHGNKGSLVSRPTRFIRASHQIMKTYSAVLKAFVNEAWNTTTDDQTLLKDAQCCFINDSCFWILFWKWAVCCAFKAFSTQILPFVSQDIGSQRWTHIHRRNRHDNNACLVDEVNVAKALKW